MNDTDCLIPLTQGQFATVSPEDYKLLSVFKWYAVKKRAAYYARRAGPLPLQRVIYMHRVVAEQAGLPKSKQYDHEDRNPLNNRRENIRPCTRSQNGANQAKWVGCSSRFKGVTRSGKKWKAQIVAEGKHYYLGIFQSEQDAHKAYVAAAIRFFGEFAHF